jgi:hypothetical protein
MSATAVAETTAATTTAEPASTQAATTQTTTAPTVTTTEAAATTATTQGPESVAASQTTTTAPTSYTLTLPDKGVLDQSDLDAVVAMAKSKGWTNEQAQEAANELNANLQAQATAFKSELDQHPEIGGTKFQAAQEHAMRALDRFLPATSLEGAAFRTAMNKSGYGNYAPLMLMLSRIGKAMAEDKPTAGAATTSDAKPKSAVNLLYGKTTPEPE